jgi:NAD+ kinase
MGMLSSVGVVLHPARAPQQAIDTIGAWARAKEMPLLGLPDEVGRLACDASPVPLDELAARSSLLVSIGGDGTMLRTLRLSRSARTPVLGVNFGRLGFLAEVDLAELPEALSAIDGHRYTLEARQAVTCASAAVGTDPMAAAAFNDIALVRVPGEGVAVVEVVVEGQPFVRYAADAVVVSTPTGSTAYSFSAGGPIVSPTVPGLLVIPAAAHSSFNRALMLNQDERLTLRLLPTCGRLAVEVDGNVTGQVGPGDELDFQVLPDAGRVVRLGQTTFYERARRKLGVEGSAEAG